LELVSDRACGLCRQPRLADAAGADDGRQARVRIAHRGAQVGDVRIASDGRRGRRGDPHERRGGGLRAARRGHREVGILGENCALELAQLDPRLEAELLDERRPRVPVRLERVGLAAGAVERQHQPAVQPLAQRMLGYQSLQLRHELRVTPGAQLGLESRLERDQPLLLERCDRALRERRERQVGERRAAPQRERVLEELERPPGMVGGQLTAPLVEQSLEAVRVEVLGAEPQLIAVAAGGQHVLGELLAQPRHVHLERLQRVRGRALAPQLVDQPLVRERLVRVQEQHCEDGAALAPAERNGLGPLEGLQRAENPDIHASRGTRPHRNVTAQLPLCRRAETALPDDGLRCRASSQHRRQSWVRSSPSSTRRSSFAATSTPFVHCSRPRWSPCALSPR
jgi:hypothetical protein